jgi:hypothetical protein
VATSSAVPGRRIGRADGPDEASFGHFVKNSSIFNEINPQSGLPSQTFFVKKTQNFSKINLQSNLHRFRKISKETL